MIGITGSVGRRRRRISSPLPCLDLRGAASERSFNNELGLPLTLLNAPDDAQWVVLEMGARGVGHVARPGPGGTSRRRHRDERRHGPRGVLR